MIRLKVSVKGLDAAIKGLETTVQAVKNAAGRALDKEGEACRKIVSMLTPRSPRAGTSDKTADLWRYGAVVALKGNPFYQGAVDHPFNTPGARHPITGEIVNNSEFELLAALEFGTSAHRIEAKPGGVLRFMGDDGKFVFRREVRHPGTKPYAMTRTGAVSARATLRTSVQNAVDRAIDARNRRQAEGDARRAWVQEAGE